MFRLLQIGTSLCVLLPQIKIQTVMQLVPNAPFAAKSLIVRDKQSCYLSSLRLLRPPYTVSPFDPI